VLNLTHYLVFYSSFGQISIFGCSFRFFETTVVIRKQRIGLKMTTLATLKLTDAKKPNQIPQVIQRRRKLEKRVWQQIELAKSLQSGTNYTVKRFRSFTDRETGARKQVETDVRVKQWSFTTDTGKLAVSVRYGSKILELAPKKYAVEIANEKDLVKTLDIIKTAVINGELDTAIESVALKLRDGFNK
jgi:hypothetical protein